jgi:hypothetical protein
MTTRIIRRPSLPRNASAMRFKNLQRLSKALASASKVSKINSMSCTIDGLHQFVFGPLPEELTEKKKFDICERWATEHFTVRGISCLVAYFDTGPAFSYRASELAAVRPGGAVPDMLPTEYINSVFDSFRSAVNAELQTLGLPAD